MQLRFRVHNRNSLVSNTIYHWIKPIPPAQQINQKRKSNCRLTDLQASIAKQQLKAKATVVIDGSDIRELLKCSK